jgi:hypothetical protein
MANKVDGISVLGTADHGGSKYLEYMSSIRIMHSNNNNQI